MSTPTETQNIFKKYNAAIDAENSELQTGTHAMERIRFFSNTYSHLPRKKKKAAKKRQEKEKEASMFYVAGKIMEDFVEKFAKLHCIKQIMNEPIKEGLSKEDTVKQFIERSQKIQNLF